MLAALAQADAVQDTQGESMSVDQLAAFRQNALATSDAENEAQEERSHADYQMVVTSELVPPMGNARIGVSQADMDQNAAGWSQPIVH